MLFSSSYVSSLRSNIIWRKSLQYSEKRSMSDSIAQISTLAESLFPIKILLPIPSAPMTKV